MGWVGTWNTGLIDDNLALAVHGHPQRFEQVDGITSLVAFANWANRIDTEPGIFLPNHRGVSQGTEEGKTGNHIEFHWNLTRQFVVFGSGCVSTFLKGIFHITKTFDASSNLLRWDTCAGHPICRLHILH